MSRAGKGIKSETLPARNAMTSIVKGDIYNRSISNYAKKAPSITTMTPSILMIGRQ
jgi:hypothetical protein